MCDGESKDSGSLDGLMGAIDAFLGGPPLEITASDLGARLIRLRHGLDLLELRFARDAALFATTNEYEVQGSTSPIDWVRHQCAMSGNAAARSIATGEQAAALPASVAALEDGRIGFAHLSLLAGTARALAGPSAAPGFDEGPLLGLALEHSVSRFSFDCTHARHAGDAAGVLAEHVDAVEHRRLDLSTGEDRCLNVQGRLDPVGGATVRVFLEAICGPTGVGDERSRSRRLADALVELASHALDHGFATERGGVRPHLQLTASVCHRHHWSVHEGGWQVVRTEGREVLAIPPAHPYQSWARAPDGAP